MKKIIYGIGALASMAVPMASAISCGGGEKAVEVVKDNKITETFKQVTKYIKSAYDSGENKSAINQTDDLTKVTVNIQSFTKVHVQEIDASGDINLSIDKHTYTDEDQALNLGVKSGEETWRLHVGWKDVVFLWKTFGANLTHYTNQEFEALTKKPGWDRSKQTVFNKFAKNFKSLDAVASKLQDAVSRMINHKFKVGSQMLSLENFYTPNDAIVVQFPEVDKNGAPLDIVNPTFKTTKVFRFINK